LRNLCITATLCVLSCPVSCLADRLTPFALEFGSARQQLWVMLAERPDGGLSYANSLARQLALDPDLASRPYLAGSDFSVTPILKLDRNVNSGIASDTVLILGLPFLVNAESRAVRALTAGAALNAGLSFGLAPGLTFAMSGRSEHRRALGRDMLVTRNTLTGTLGYTAQNWTYLSANFLLDQEERALATGKTATTALTVGKLFGNSDAFLQDVSLTVLQEAESTTGQRRLRGNWTGIFADIGVVDISLEVGERLDGELVPVSAVSVAYSAFLIGAPTTLSASYGRSEGGVFFGLERHDDRLVLKAEREISRQVSINISYEVSDSSIDSFDVAGADFGINFTALEF
jgi:hypothetical protein